MGGITNFTVVPVESCAATGSAENVTMNAPRASASRTRPRKHDMNSNLREEKARRACAPSVIQPQRLAGGVSVSGTLRDATSSVLVAEDDAAAGEVVWRNLDRHAIALQNPDAEAAHVAAERREHVVTIGQLHTESRIR